MDLTRIRLDRLSDAAGDRRTETHLDRQGGSDLAVLYEPEDVLKTVVVEEDGLQNWSVRTLQDLRHSS